MTYRFSQASDFEELAAVLKSSYEADPWNESWSLSKALRRIQAIMHNFGSTCIVAEDSGTLIGGVLGFIDPYADADFFFISELFVHPEYRRKGIGSQLMLTLEDELNKKGIKITQLISIDNNITFYSHSGYQKDAVSVMYKTLSQRNNNRKE